MNRTIDEKFRANHSRWVSISISYSLNNQKIDQKSTVFDLVCLNFAASSNLFNFSLNYVNVNTCVHSNDIHFGHFKYRNYAMWLLRFWCKFVRWMKMEKLLGEHWWILFITSSIRKLTKKSPINHMTKEQRARTQTDTRKISHCFGSLALKLVVKKWSKCTGTHTLAETKRDGDRVMQFIHLCSILKLTFSSFDKCAKRDSNSKHKTKIRLKLFHWWRVMDYIIQNSMFDFLEM